MELVTVNEPHDVAAPAEGDRVGLNRPDFFIVGAPRCGTTALYTYLRQHPQIYMPEWKEPHHFAPDLDSKSSIRSREEYLALFGPAASGRRVGEASVFYLASEAAPRLIHAFDPEARIVAMLRNPIDVMYSNHRKNLTLSVEDVDDFGEALRLEPERIAGRSLPRGLENDRFKLSYRRNVRFDEQLGRYFDRFGRERVHVILYDDFCEASREVFFRVCDFLGVERYDGIDFTVVNENVELRSHALTHLLRQPPRWLLPLARTVLPSRAFRRSLMARIDRLNAVRRRRRPIPPALRRRLVEELRPEVDRLSALLDRDLSMWLRA
ncbi:MAG TPA: sulfotransferase [Isosphaeraceae bacterium]|jgi:hypothetical protein|nr:sulfotransferase [Isosphaeraceae bacterium]